MTLDTHVIRQFTLPIAIIGTVLMWKGYIPWWAVSPLSWVSFLLYITPRHVVNVERNR